MFLYWRKRGAYELEALPGALAELELGAVERFSWSSTLDIIEDLGGRCGPTFPGGHSRGSGTWAAWSPVARLLHMGYCWFHTRQRCGGQSPSREPLRVEERGPRTLGTIGEARAGQAASPGSLPARQSGAHTWAWSRAARAEDSSDGCWPSSLGSASVLCLQDQDQVVA